MQTSAAQDATSTACRNCATPLAGRFCHNCGEPAPDPHELSVKHLVHDAVHEFTHLDGKVFRTLWLLIRRPGFLTGEFWAGRRKPYIRPLRLYIVIAAIHLLAVSAHLYNLTFLTSMDAGGRLRPMLDRAAARHQVPYATLELKFNQTLMKTYSVVQYLAVLGFAVVPWFVYRKRRPHYVEHLVFSLHVYCFYFALTALVSLFLTPQQWRASPLPLVTAAYILFAVRRLYGASWLRAAGAAVLLRLGLFAAEFIALGVSMGAGFVAIY